MITNESRSTRINHLSKRSNDSNQTQSQCHPPNLPSHQGPQTQGHTSHQRREVAGGTPKISEWFGPGEWVTLNCNVSWLDLWYLKGRNWEVSSPWMKMDFQRQYDQSTGKEVCHPESRSAWCGVRGLQGEWWWWRRSEEWNWGAQIQAEERLSSGAAHPCWASAKEEGVW